jgi:PadR family transcriptional regulator, regulatory protein PadR
MTTPLRINPESLKGHLDLLLLTALESQPSHGYAIAEWLRERSRQTFDLPEGTLYPALHRLERAGLLTSRWSAESGRRRRVYQLNVRGRKALTAQRGEWREFARAVQAVVGAGA